MTVGNAHGTIINPRTKPRPSSGWSSSSATSRPSTISATTVRTVNTTVMRSADQNSDESRAVVKLANPTQPPPPPINCVAVNDKRTVSTSG